MFLTTRLLLLAILLSFCLPLAGQFLPEDYTHFSGNEHARLRYQYRTDAHSTVRTGIYNVLERDSLSHSETGRWTRHQHTSRVMRKLRNEHFVQIDSGDFFLSLNPLFDFSLGADITDDSIGRGLYTNTRGVMLQGYLGKKLSFYSSVYENQSVFPRFLFEQIDRSGVVPGQGRVKPFKNRGYDYAYVQGMVWYRPFFWWTMGVGHHKQFVGDGYRSLLLSDFSFNAPQVTSDMHFFKGRLRYWMSYQALSTLERLPATWSPEAPFVRKAGNFFALSYAPIPRLEITLFEGNVHRLWDGRSQQPPVAYYFPVIFANALSGGFHSDSAACVPGFNIRFSMLPTWIAYGQFVPGVRRPLRNESAAFQLGTKWFDAFNLDHLMLQLEFNTSGTQRYSDTPKYGEYEHYNGSLAHPNRYDLNEWIVRGRYSFRDFYLQAGWVAAVYQKVEEYPVITTGNNQPVWLTYKLSRRMTSLTAEAGYLINYRTQMTLSLQGVLRADEHSAGQRDTQWLSVVFRTGLRNVYYDF